MKKNAKLIFLAVVASMLGCQSNPTAPSVDDAKSAWHNILKQNRLTKDLDLVDLKKTDGQMSEVNGVKIYTYFYEAQVKHLTPVGHWKPGDVETIKSNYGFQKTENGWQGPDGVVYAK